MEFRREKYFSGNLAHYVDSTVSFGRVFLVWRLCDGRMDVSIVGCSHVEASRSSVTSGHACVRDDVCLHAYIDVSYRCWCWFPPPA